MKKEKLTFNQSNFNDEIESYSILIPLMNEVLKAYGKMELPPLVNNQLTELVLNPQAVIYDIMTQGHPIELHGFKINRNTAFDLLEKPEGYEELITAIDALKAQQNYDWHLRNTVIEANVVVLQSALIESITERHTVYAKNENHLKAFNFAEAVVDAARLHFGEGAIDIPDTVSSLIEKMQPNYTNQQQYYRLKYSKIAAFKDPQ